MKQNLLIEQEEIHDVARFLLVKFRCPRCRKFIKVIKLINLRLPVNRRIQIIECMHWENHGVKLEPIMDKFEEELNEQGVFPLCYLTKEGMENGLILDFTDAEYLKSYLNKFLEDEFIY